MTRPRIVIVGAGLGGSILANSLWQAFDVTVIERGAATVDPRYPVVDIGWPANMEPHFGSGPGGSTQLWHNGLIEIDSEIFAEHWPIPKSDLGRYYTEAFQLLSGVPHARIKRAIEDLREKYHALGLPGENLPGLYYPRSPMNVWQNFKLNERVKLVHGNVTGINKNDSGEIESLTVSSNNRTLQVSGDVFVLSAGGLGTPILLQKLSQISHLPGLAHAGFHYEDHPMGFAGEVQLNKPLYQLWNYHVSDTGGNLRLPLVVSINGVQISFQLRPAASYYREGRRVRVSSVLHKLRRAPWNPVNYLGLFTHWDDVLDILSFKFNIRLPTKKYTLLMMAQMPPSEDCSIWSEVDTATGQERRIRRWTLTEQFQQDLQSAVNTLLEKLAPVTTKSRIFPDWIKGLATGAHHSGTARMSATPNTGVCDQDGRVHGVKNLYICDGSIIPASGIANTGLTISALALRLGDHLREKFKNSGKTEKNDAHSISAAQSSS